MDASESFAASYEEARTKFLEAAAAVKADIEHVNNRHRGPSGEALATDVAWLGPRDAELVPVSRTELRLG
ncbi:hypothetical protein FHW79_002826 [Azospirillum sp. OGB3]|uniref:DUF2817 domain-containing protein n=1 Tax=Azospirillum sp. OGB3 TaxID=2587012 RepID=UPI00160569AC|nr:DUF2817 domain-containing protein [Azospirillum sp. OGB3]MBB3265206.1 hypothetical protein [Azospirillum sp. OGB3]